MVSVLVLIAGRLLLSSGEGYDSQLCVWDWKAGVLLAKQHTQAELLQASFVSEEPAGGGSGGGATITTVGKAGHFKVRPAARQGAKPQGTVNRHNRTYNISRTCLLGRLTRRHGLSLGVCDLCSCGRWRCRRAAP